MRYGTFFIILILFGNLWGTALAQPDNMSRIEKGTYMPFYNSDKDSVTVESFYLDKFAVTNAEFLEFVKENPKWRRSEVKSVFAQDGYLKHWGGDLDLGPNADKIKDSPVTNVWPLVIKSLSAKF